MIDRSPAVNRSPDLIITLVHGTWGRGFFPKLRFSTKTRWFEAGSPFFSQLQDGLFRNSIKHQITALRWSGANSLRHRDNAAQELAHLLREQRATFPSSRQLVVGHSHGGNVALLALKYLDASIEVPFVATLATPFLEIYPGGLSAFQLLVMRSSVLIFFLWAVQRGIFLLEQHSVIVRDTLDSFGWFTISNIGFAVLFILQLMVIKSSSKSIPYYCKIASLKSAHRIGNNLLVMRGIDDEASLTLAFGAIINRLTAGAGRFLHFAISVFLIPWMVLFATHAFYMLSGSKDYSSDFFVFINEAVRVLMLPLLSCVPSYIFVPSGIWKGIGNRARRTSN